MSSLDGALPFGTAQMPDPRLFLIAIDRLYRDSKLGVLIESADRTVLYANHELHTLLRLPTDDDGGQLGQSTDRYLQPGLAWVTNPDDFLTSMTLRRQSAHSRIGDDIELTDGRFLERHYAPIDEGSGVVAYLWIYREITRRESDRRDALESRSKLAAANETLSTANSSLNRANRLLEALVHIQDLLLTTGDEQAVFDEILRAGLAMTHSEFGFFAETAPDPNDGHDVLVNRALSDISWDYATQEIFEHRATKPLIFDNASSLFGAVHQTGQPLITNAPREDPRATGLPPGHPPLNSFAGLPVLARGRVLGVLGLANSPDGYAPDLYEWMQPFIATCATVLLNVRGMRERKSVLERLSVMSMRAEQASQAKNIFLSRMSHEVRTPMNGILGFAQLIGMRAESETDRADAQRIVAAGRHLLGLFGDVIDLSTIEAGQITVRNETVNIHDELHECQEFVTELQRERNATIEHQLNLDLKTATLDPLRLRQVLLNLLGNALKYSDPGSYILLKASNPTANVLRIDVIDDGPGIPRNRWEAVFEPFQRLENTARNVSGRGLGLAISRSVSEAMGGRLDLVESNPGRTLFRLEIPTTPSTETIQHVPVTAVLGNSQHTGHVLYVEDVLDNADIIRLSISLLHPRVTLEIATSGSQARESWRNHRPDLVLLDLHLPDVDGFDLLDELERRGIPVVILTADATPETQRRIDASYAQDSLIKPAALADLDRVLRAQLPEA